MRARQVGGGECEDLKSQKLSEDHNQPRQCELYHRPPVAESGAAEATPALTSTDEVDIEKETTWEEAVSYDYSNRCTYEAPFKFLV
jgi:hypothetical protein